MSALAGPAGSRGGTSPAIAAYGITRSFPGVVANDRVTLEVAPGEIHGLLGENGSGKSTLCKILSGLYRPDEGEIRIAGRAVRLSSPRGAYAAGVFLVQQHFSLVDRLSVAENVVLGWSPTDRRWIRPKRIAAEVAAAAERFRITVDPDAFVWQLSVGQRQRVELLKALYRGARILLLDEPTAVLTPQECEQLFASLRAMVGHGASVVFVTHKLPEVMAVCERVTVLRHGRSVGTLHLAEDGLEPRDLARLMVGHEVTAVRRAGRRDLDAAPVVLELTDLTVNDETRRPRVDGVSLQVRRGEIVGVAGVAGNGQRELADAVAGLARRAGGSVTVSGRPLRNGDPRAAIRARLAYVCEDRMGTGLVPSLSVTDNVILKSFRSREVRRGPLLRARSATGRTQRVLERFGIKGRARSLVRELSGGNAQKVMLGRELLSRPAVLVAAAPTRGLDVAAAEQVRQELVAAAADGVAVLLLSEDLDEVLDLSDRVAVMYRGRVVSVVDPAAVTRDDVGLAMAGLREAG